MKKKMAQATTAEKYMPRIIFMVPPKDANYHV